MKAMTDFSGKTLLYTGAAGGLGQTTTLSFLSAGATVVAVDNDPAKIEFLKKAYNASGPGRLVIASLDLSDLARLRSELESVSKELGGFDIVINNAAIYPSKPFEEFTIEEHQTVQRINVDAGIVCVQVALPHMRAMQWGRIINIASAHGLVASADKAAYVSAKHGLVGLTKVAAIENANHGITCNAICPGWVLTPLVEQQIEARARDQGIAVDQAREDLVREKQPMLDYTTPEKIGALAVFLCGEAASTITGAALSIDGGWVAQ